MIFAESVGVGALVWPRWGKRPDRAKVCRIHRVGVQACINGPRLSDGRRKGFCEFPMSGWDQFSMAGPVPTTPGVPANLEQG